MNPVNPLLILPSLFIALYTCSLLLKRFGPPPLSGRYATLDGLRGYLALSVFLHHASIWYFYLRSGTWTIPPSKLYTHLGQSSVTIFFMITAFLFVSKILDSRNSGMDWLRLMISRLFRLAPLYLFAMLLMFAVVAWLTGGRLRVPASQLLQSVVQWMGFTVLGAPSVNGLAQTHLLVAGVTWSLVYEWAFYVALPLIALLCGASVPLAWLGLSVLGLVAFAALHLEHRFLIAFLGGVAASLFARQAALRRLAATRASSFVILGCALAASRYASAYDHAPMLLLSIAFILIAAGNDMYGLFTHPASRMLGEMTYGIYLLHGLLLFVTFRLALGERAAAGMSVAGHWLLTMALTPLLILICFGCFRWIETPAMRSAGPATAWLRLRGGAAPTRQGKA